MFDADIRRLLHALESGLPFELSCGAEDKEGLVLITMHWSDGRTDAVQLSADDWAQVKENAAWLGISVEQFFRESLLKYRDLLADE